MTPLSSDPPALEANELTKIYASRRGRQVAALDKVSFQVHGGGEVHGLLGPNGSGKTTAIRCALSLIRPTAGTVAVYGADSTTSFDHVAHRVGAIVEGPKLFGGFTGRRTLELLAMLRELPSTSIDAVLELVDLQDRADDRCRQYSLGMRQRLAIACALLDQPDLLVLDEPTNGLDPTGIVEMRATIAAVASGGTSILVSSHLLGEVEQVCTNATIINRGRVVTSGTLESLLRTSRSTDSGLIVTVADPDAAVAALTAGGVAVEALETHRFRVDGGPGRAAEVSRVLGEAGTYPTSINAERRSLEDVFLDLTATPLAADQPDLTPEGASR